MAGHGACRLNGRAHSADGPRLCIRVLSEMHDPGPSRHEDLMLAWLELGMLESHDMRVESSGSEQADPVRPTE